MQKRRKDWLETQVLTKDFISYKIIYKSLRKERNVVHVTIGLLLLKLSLFLCVCVSFLFIWNVTYSTGRRFPLRIFLNILSKTTPVLVHNKYLVVSPCNFWLATLFPSILLTAYFFLLTSSEEMAEILSTWTENRKQENKKIVQVKEKKKIAKINPHETHLEVSQACRNLVPKSLPIYKSFCWVQSKLKNSKVASVFYCRNTYHLIFEGIYGTFSQVWLTSSIYHDKNENPGHSRIFLDGVTMCKLSYKGFSCILFLFVLSIIYSCSHGKLYISIPWSLSCLYFSVSTSLCSLIALLKSGSDFSLVVSNNLMFQVHAVTFCDLHHGSCLWNQIVGLALRFTLNDCSAIFFHKSAIRIGLRVW